MKYNDGSDRLTIVGMSLIYLRVLRDYTDSSHGYYGIIRRTTIYDSYIPSSLK